jgi:hypothetical protein
MSDCRLCGEEIEPPARAEIKTLCLWCGEEQAKIERKSWTVIQEYSKGGYMYVSAESAFATLKQTNPKEVRTA